MKEKCPSTQPSDTNAGIAAGQHPFISELLHILADAQADVQAGRTAPINETFSSLREYLLALKNQ